MSIEKYWGLPPPQAKNCGNREKERNFRKDIKRGVEELKERPSCHVQMEGGRARVFPPTELSLPLY